jgi:type IV pilus assembly protein PilC
MVYPAFILGTFLIVGILIMVMVMPSLAEILTEAGQDLPWPTRLLIGTSNLLVNWGWLMLIIAAMGGFGLWQYLKTKQGKAQWDTLKLKLPIFGKILQKTYLARFADNLNVMIKGGVSIIQALDISGRVIGNYVFQQIVFQTRDEVKTGRSITSSLEKHKEFPPLFYQMIKTGESTGKLDEILEKLSIFYNKEVDNIVNNLSQILEPLMIVILGIAVSILVFAVYMPIYNLAGAF